MHEKNVEDYEGGALRKQGTGRPSGKRKSCLVFADGHLWAARYRHLVERDGGAEGGGGGELH